MANPKHLNILKKGVNSWNKWIWRQLLRNSERIKPDLSEANLSGTLLESAYLNGANLSKTNFNNADLSSADLRGADLKRADFGGARLVWTNFDGADLSGANFYRAKLFKAHFNGAILSGANLSEADLSETDFSGANLRGANLFGATLNLANFNWAKLTHANFSKADIGLAIFRSCGLELTNFTQSRVYGTIFANVNLSQAKGLDRIRHEGPSTISFDTIQRSQGKIPEIFLRGIGIGDELIATVRAMGGAIQFYSCFISYSNRDQLFAERMYEGLQAKGVRCWFAPHDVQGGRKLYEQIDNAIQMHERLLLILSPHSINSEWVRTEISKARKREINEKRRMLFPVLLKISYKELREWECFDPDTGKDSAREIREYYIPDFSEWESAKRFKEEFEKLIRDLKKAENVES